LGEKFVNQYTSRKQSKRRLQYDWKITKANCLAKKPDNSKEQRSYTKRQSGKTRIFVIERLLHIVRQYRQS